MEPTCLPWCSRCSFLPEAAPLVRTPHEQTALQRQIAAKDKQIDALVNELYGLTEEEIGIFEGEGTEEPAGKEVSPK